MKILAIIYLLLIIIEFTVRPVKFGQQKTNTTYEYPEWIIGLIIHMPLAFLLYMVATNN